MIDAQPANRSSQKEKLKNTKNNKIESRRREEEQKLTNLKLYIIMKFEELAFIIKQIQTPSEA